MTVKTRDAAAPPVRQLQNLVVNVGLPHYGQLVQFQLAGEHGARFVGRRQVTQLGDMMNCAEYGDLSSHLMTSWKPVRDCT